MTETLVRTTTQQAYLQTADGDFYLHQRVVKTYWCTGATDADAFEKRTFTAWENLGTQAADLTDTTWVPDGPGLDWSGPLSDAQITVTKRVPTAT